MSDSIEKRFCFDIQADSQQGVTFTFQALSEADRKAWLDIMDGKEPVRINSEATTILFNFSLLNRRIHILVNLKIPKNKY